MKPAAIYARYSSDLQNDRSIEDQIALCEAWARHNGYTVVSRFEDRAISGTKFRDRAGLMGLLTAARGRAFSVVVVEHGDRLSRHAGDIHHIREALNFADVRIMQVSGGELDALQASVSGLVSSLTLAQLAQKVRRGQAGNIDAGLRAGGKAYGYRPVPGQPGKLDIVPEEAAIVRRIYTEFIAGSSPRQIAHNLNRDGIKPPQGTFWNASTLYGWGQRGNGILNNELYKGVLIWNRVRMVRDPESRRRVSRPNPPDEWKRQAVPELAIVAADEFAAVKNRRPMVKRQPQRKRKYLLSGLLKCPDCGGGMSVKDIRKGEVRVMCSVHKESRACSNARSYNLGRIERAVLAGLREHLLQPVLIQEFVLAYNRERQRLDRDRQQSRSGNEQRLAVLSADIDRAVDMMIRGTVSAELMAPKIKALEAEKSRLACLLAQAPVIALHTGARDRYLAAIDALPGHTAEDTALAEEIRGLVSRVTVFDGYRLEIAGDLSRLLTPVRALGDVGGSGGVFQSLTPQEKEPFIYIFRRAA